MITLTELAEIGMRHAIDFWLVLAAAVVGALIGLSLVS